MGLLIFITHMKIKDYFNLFNNKGESFMIKMPRGTQDLARSLLNGVTLKIDYTHNGIV